MKQKVNIFLHFSYLIVVIGLFFYSFTQVDLNLTLSRWPPMLVMQNYFQNIGYYQRPLSVFLYIVIVFLFFIFYFLFLWLARIEKIRGIWGLIIATTVILTFSYNAFSYDLFNYIFDAKIITFYQQNPYLQKALDYPSDHMVSFMRSTHRTYPYGPAWISLTIPLSLVGFNVFLPTLYLFKGLIAASFLGTVYFLNKILDNLKMQNTLYGICLLYTSPSPRD